MQVDEAIHCRIHICRSQTSSHPVLHWYPCTACDNHFCLLCCRLALGRSLSCEAATHARRNASGRNNGMVCRKVPALDSCSRCPQKMCRRNNGVVCRKVPALDSCNRCPQKNGPQEQRRGLQEGSCAGFLQQMSATKMGRRNNGVVCRKVPALDSCSRCPQKDGPQEPSPRLGF